METRRAYLITELNALSQSEFVSIIGPVFENSTWIAENTWRRGRSLT